jgi:antitoxin component of MazEF toxin-antitoxin module
MSATNKRGKLTRGASKKAASKNVVMRGGRTSTGAGNTNVGRRADYMNGGKTEYMAPKAFITSRLRAIGNSRGVILNSQLIEAAGLNAEADIVIEANKGVITIKQMKAAGINTDLSTWDKQFKAAIKKGAKPEGDLFEGMANHFDSKEW